MTDQEKRVTAKRKEENDLSEPANLDDSEFAADTWTQAVFDTDQPTSSSDGLEDFPTSVIDADSTENSAGKEGDLSRDPNKPGRAKQGDAAVNPGGDDVEAAAEIAEPIRSEPRQNDGSIEQEKQGSGTSGVGIAGLVMSILAMFLWPYLLGAIGIVLGFIAYRGNARTLGVWAMVIGAIAILGALIIYPYYTAR